MRLSTVFSTAFLASLSLVQISCGGAGGASVSSLSQLPDPASMVSTSTSSTGMSFATISGTAPLMMNLKTDADTYFWNGLVAKIGAGSWSSLTLSERQNDAHSFWGGVNGGPAGQGGCFMAQNTAQVFGRLLESAGSSCYMKNMPNAASGVTITPTPLGGNGGIFSQEAADKLVKVSVTGNTGEGDGGGDGTMDVFIKVFGSNTVTSDVYRVQLYFCKTGAVDGYETFEVNKSTLAYSASSVHKESNTSKFSSSVSAHLTSGTSGSLAFDPTKDREVTMNGLFNTDTFRAKITITSDNLIYSLMNHSNSNGGNSFSDKISSVAQFSGDDANTVRFLAAGFNGYQSFTTSGGSDSHSFSGALEWHDTYYASIATSDSELYTKANATNLSTDSFFTESTSPNVDFSGLDCTSTADYRVTMDFTDGHVKAIKETCDGDHKVRGSDSNYCWGGSVQTAQQKVQNQCRTGGC